jgi:hypothetical protein
MLFFYLKSILFLTIIIIIFLFNQTLLANLPTNFSTMNKQEIKTIVDRQARAWETGDVATMIADFADDSLFISSSDK